MSDQIRTAAELVAGLRAHYILHERVEPISQRLSLLVASRIADLHAGRTADAHGIAVIGGSGAGKSRALEDLVRRAQERLSSSAIPDAKIISLEIPSPATLKSVGRAVLRALGYGMVADRQAWYIWDLVRKQLRDRKVIFLHLDEAQDLGSRGTHSELTSVTSMMKSLMNDTIWPVGLIVSGTESLEAILEHDFQLARRMDTIYLAPLSHVHAAEIFDLVRAYARRAGLGVVACHGENELGERLMQAAAFQFGQVIRLTLAAIEIAALERAQTLENRHFAISYGQWSGCSDAFNPFIIGDFTRIDPRGRSGRGVPR